MAGATLRFITPKPSDIFDLKAFEAAYPKTLNKTADAVKKDFESVTATWRNKPSFRGKRATARRAVATMWGNKNTWVWANEGTRPHIIKPKAGKMLRFQSGYKRKTTPGKLGSSSGGKFGSVVFSKGVRHPGTKAGRYNLVSAVKQEPILVNALQRDIDRAAS